MINITARKKNGWHEKLRIVNNGSQTAIELINYAVEMLGGTPEEQIEIISDEVDAFERGYTDFRFYPVYLLPDGTIGDEQEVINYYKKNGIGNWDVFFEE